MQSARTLIRKLIKDPAIPAGLVEVPSRPGSSHMHLWPKPGTNPVKLSIEARVAMAERPIDPHMPNNYLRRLFEQQQEQAAAREEIRKAETRQRVAAMVEKKRAAGELVEAPKKRALKAAMPSDTLRAASLLRLTPNKQAAHLDDTRAHIYILIGKGGTAGITMSVVRKENDSKPVQASIEKLISLGLVEVLKY